MSRRNYRVKALILAATLAVSAPLVPQAQAGFSLGDAANFAVLYTGGGGNTFNTNNTSINGNIGIGGTGQFAATGPGTITGNILFAAPNTGQFSLSNTTFNGLVSYNNTNVTTDLANLSTLSTTLGGEAGTPLSVSLNNNQSQTINAINGTLDANGNRVFAVSSFRFNNGATLTINGDGAGDSVVLNFAGLQPQFGGTILLTGISSDQVLFNVTGNNNTLQINTNGSTATGTFLNPNGAISAVHSVINGRLFGGDSQNMQVVSGVTLTAPTAVPEPATIFICLSGLTTLGLAGALRRFRRRT